MATKHFCHTPTAHWAYRDYTDDELAKYLEDMDQGFRQLVAQGWYSESLNPFRKNIECEIERRKLIWEGIYDT